MLLAEAAVRMGRGAVLCLALTGRPVSTDSLSLF